MCLKSKYIFPAGMRWRERIATLVWQSCSVGLSREKRKKKNRKLETRWEVEQLEGVSSSSVCVCVCMAPWRDQGAKNWRLVKNGERTSSDTSSQSSVGRKELEKKKSFCGNAREERKMSIGARHAQLVWTADRWTAGGGSASLHLRQK